MANKITGKFLSFLRAKTGLERLVYFIVSYHIVLNLYFINESVQIYVELNIKSLLVPFFTSKTLTAYFGDFFVFSGTALAISFLMSLLLDSIRLVWFPSMLNKRKEKLKFLC